MALRVAEWQELGPGFFARRWSGIRGRERHRCTVRGLGEVTVRTASSDAAVFRQVFCERQYDLDLHSQGAWVARRYGELLDAGRTPIIVDLGANNGASALWFATCYAEATVVAVEPDPESAAICRENTAGRSVLVVEAAIGSEPGSVDLVDEGNGSWAVQTRRAVDGGVAVVTVPELVARCGEGAELFIVMVAIEGFESDLFAANLEWLDQAAAVMIEPHDWLLPGSGTSTDFQKAMAERGFDLLISGENLLYVRRV